MDRYPVSPGHTLLMPKKHYTNLLAMPPNEVGKLYSLVPVVARATIAAVNADGFNVGQNNGTAASQIVPHVHVHIIPRFENDSPDGRWPTRHVAANDELDNLAVKIRSILKLATEMNK